MTNKHNGSEAMQKSLQRVEILLSAILLKLDNPEMPLETVLLKAEAGLEGFKSEEVADDGTGVRGPEAERFLNNLLQQLHMSKEELAALINELRERNVLSSQETNDLRLLLRGVATARVKTAAMKLTQRGARRLRAGQQPRAS
ncbi:MAG: hypothetical protein KatS3mg071_1671 [Meiothermus sp.]|nr:MAG: hypothetical protein KatS3mg071_1671 [Meiothermus sp.]